jgi:hypothetical protein
MEADTMADFWLRWSPYIAIVILVATNAMLVGWIIIKKLNQPTNSSLSAGQPYAEKTRTIIAIGLLVGFFAVLFALLFVDMPQSGHDVLLVMIGALVAAMGDMRGFYFGSSNSSEKKSEMIDKFIDKTPNVAPIVVPVTVPPVTEMKL